MEFSADLLPPDADQHVAIVVDDADGNAREGVEVLEQRLQGSGIDNLGELWARSRTGAGLIAGNHNSGPEFHEYQYYQHVRGKMLAAFSPAPAASHSPAAS
jgi:hypothetical protein